METEEEVSYKVNPNDEIMNYIVGRGFSAKEYFNQGRKNAFTFTEAIHRCKPALLKGKQVLDYGCGHGRICRYLPKLLSPSKFFVVDVWDDAVNFCAEEFNATPFLITDEKTLSDYNTQFDVILSYSVFSHLPPSSFKFYMSEIAKCLKNDGILLFTTKGEASAKHDRVTFEDGFKFNLNVIPNETKGRLPGAKYGAMYVTPQYVEKMLQSLGLKILDHVPTSMTQQDLYVAELQ